MSEHENATTERGVDLIAAEHRRQIEVERWTPEHDAEHPGDLVFAAVSYALPVGSRGMKSVALSPRASGRWGAGARAWVPSSWPWAGVFWKPTPDDRIRELVKAGALIAAEIDHLLTTGASS